MTPKRRVINLLLFFIIIYSLVKLIAFCLNIFSFYYFSFVSYNNIICYYINIM